MKITTNAVTSTCLLVAGENKLLRNIITDIVARQAVCHSSALEQWIEIDDARFQSILPDYEDIVVEMVKLKYSYDEELAIQRKALSDIASGKPLSSEYIVYNNYVESCKQRAKNGEFCLTQSEQTAPLIEPEPFNYDLIPASFYEKPFDINETH